MLERDRRWPKGMVDQGTFEASPNPRLQRTRSALQRSPLSRKPLGGRSTIHEGGAIWMRSG
jgi:hypothetical protein